MTPQDWELPFARCIGMLMVGERLAERDERGNPVLDDDLLVLLNAHHEAITFVLPGEGWVPVLDTASRQPAALAGSYLLQGRSMAMLARGAKH
jgi:glycogen operon protein